MRAQTESGEFKSSLCFGATVTSTKMMTHAVTERFKLTDLHKRRKGLYKYRCVTEQRLTRTQIWLPAGKKGEKIIAWYTTWAQLQRSQL